MRVFLFLLFPLFTQALEFKSFVDKTEVGINEAFVLSFQFESEGSLPKQVSAPELFQLKDFYFLDESSSQQSSIQIINGQMSKTSILLKNYRLQPKAIGAFKIPALSVKTDVKTFQTQPISIKVVKNNTTAPSPAPLQAPSFPFNLPDPFQQPNSLFKGLQDFFPKREQEDIQLKLELSNSAVYKSERIRANWYVLSSSGSVRFNLSRIPVLKGFWKEKIKNKRPSIGTEVIGKTLYRKQLIDNLWLFPLKSGQLVVDSYSIQLMSFFRNGQIVSAPDKKITVKNLPTEGLDDTFTGAVGDFAVQYLIKEKEGEVNKPLSLKIIFKGSGHPRFINLPKISFPTTIEIYPPVQKSEFSDNGIGVKEFEVLIVPKKEGPLVIPSFSLSTFNPKIGQYIAHKSSDFFISIKKESTGSNLGESFLNTAEEGTKNSFLNYSPLESFYWPSFINYKNLVRFFVYLFCFFVSFLVIVFFKKIILSREKSLKEKINNKLLMIQALLDKRDWQKACINMIQLGTYVLSASQIQDSPSDWRSALKNLTPSLKEKYSSDFEKLLKELESLSFSPHSSSSDFALKQAKDLFGRIKSLINKFLTHL